MSTTLKHSKQRDAILSMLRSRYDLPTAEQLYTELKEEFPKLSLGTVYRNLALLESLGEIVRISADDASDRFDGNAHNHYHFACQICKRVDDVPIPVDLELDKAVHDALGAKVNKQTAIFFGVCKKCLKTS